MSTLKKVLALTLALAMVLSLNVFAAFKDQDKIDKECVSAMELMDALGIITGDNGNAKPLNTITRAEAATMIYRLMNPGKTDAKAWEGDKTFTDMIGHWANGYVGYAVSNGIVDGKTPTTFDPEAPVTGTEIAKMLLCCLKYNAKTQGYTGANWASAVKTDAFNANLLSNYNMSLSAPALREWVAVMFMDALKANMVAYPLNTLAVQDYTLNSKTYNYAVYEGIFTDSRYAFMNVSSGKGYSTIGGKAFKTAVDPTLLGQEIRVYYDTTSATYTAGALNKATSIYKTFATSNNKTGDTTLDLVKKSSGVYTFGTLQMKADASAVVYQTRYDFPNSELKLVSRTVAQFDGVKGTNLNCGVRAIDNDDDGDIDVILIQTYSVLVMTAKPVYSTSAETWTINYTENGAAKEKVLAADAQTGLDKVANGDTVKVMLNVANQTLDFSVLTPVNAMVTRKTVESGNVTALVAGGTTYDVMAGYTLADGSVTLGTTYSIFTDGKFVVRVANPSTTVTALPTMGLVTALGETTNAYGTKTYMVKVLTLDSKTTEYVYDTKSVSSALSTDVVFAKTVGDTTKFANTGRVYILNVNADGTVYFKNVETANLPNSYTIASANNLTYSTTNGLIGSYKIASDTKLFVESSDGKYSVATLSGLGKTIGTDAKGFSQLYVFGETGKVGTVMGGKVTLTADASTVTAANYAVVTDVYSEYDTVNSKTVNKVDMILADGTKVTKTYASELEIVAGTMYQYTLDSADVATLTASGITGYALTVVDGNYVTINGSVKVAASNVVVIVKSTSGTIAKATLANALVTGKISTAYAVYDSNTQISLLYVVIA